MRRLILAVIGCLVAAGAVAQGLTAAQKFAVLAGRSVGAGVACGVDRDLLTRVGVRIFDRIADYARDDADHSAAIELYVGATSLGAEQQRNDPRTSCAEIRRALADIDRRGDSGATGPAAPRVEFKPVDPPPPPPPDPNRTFDDILRDVQKLRKTSP